MDIKSIFIILIVSIILSTWGIGALLNEYIRTKDIYVFLSRQTFIKEGKLNKWMGVFIFKGLVTKTIYAKTNTTISLKSHGIEELERIRKIIINSEIGHSISFLISEFVFIFLSYSLDIVFVVMGTVLNIFLNVYPLLLQQMNKQRINKILKKYSC